jgi:hypothetical protein
VRSCFTSGNISSSAASFKPKNLAMDFINFYLGKEFLCKAAPSEIYTTVLSKAPRY